MRNLKKIVPFWFLVLASCGGGSNQLSETTVMASTQVSETTESVPKKSVEEVLAGWDWQPSSSLDAFRSRNVPIIEDWLKFKQSPEGNDFGFFGVGSGRKFCDDVYTLADFAAGADKIQPKVHLNTVLRNFSEDLPLLEGKLGVIVEFIVLDEAADGSQIITSNYDFFQASHELPCKTIWPVFSGTGQDFRGCRTPTVPGFDSDCVKKLKFEFTRSTETNFAYKSDFNTLSGKTPIVSAIALISDARNKHVVTERLVYLPVINRPVLLTVDVFDQSNSFEHDEIVNPATDLTIAIWNDVEADLTAYFLVNGS